MEDLVRQTIFDQVNFFILDCNSPDNESDVIHNYTHHDNISYVRLEEDPGLFAGWNVSVKNTTSDLLTNWNVDDRKSPWSLEIMRDCLSLNSDIDLVYGNTIVSQKANENWTNLESRQLYICNETSGWQDLLRNNNPHCMPMWRRDIHDRFGYFDEKYLTASDADLWLKAAKGGSKMKKINEIIGIYYYNPEGRSSDPTTIKRMTKEIHKMRKKYEPTYESHLKPFASPSPVTFSKIKHSP